MEYVSLNIFYKRAWIAFSIYITVTVSLDMTLTFVRDNTLDGFVCSQAETVFTKTVRTKTDCAVICLQYSGCVSIFYEAASLGCTGCTSLSNTNVMSMSSKGSQHYKIKDTGSTTPDIATTTSTPIRQWVQTVVAFSSEYNSGGWSANQVKGTPDVYPRYGDIGNTWAQKVKDSSQYIEIQFSEAVYITGIEIYETLNAGGIKAIKAKIGETWTTLWSVHTVQVIETSRIFAPPLWVMTSPSRDLRLEIDCTASNSWVEIDAVQLIGNRIL